MITTAANPRRFPTLPALTWLPAYDRSSLRPDLIAGLTLSAYLLPAGIGDASLAGLPAEAGIYACLFSGLVFWLFCSSKHTVITVTSALSLLIGASVGELALGLAWRHTARTSRAGDPVDQQGRREPAVADRARLLCAWHG